MSFITKQLRILTLRPSIKETPGSLTIETGLLTKLLTFFISQRKVEITPSLKSIRITHRTVYVIKHVEQIAFDAIWYIDEHHDAIGTNWGITAEGYGRTDQVESYSISLVMRNETKHFICAFRGEGAITTGWVGVLLGHDTPIDFSGTQEKEAREFVTYLSKLLGTPIRKPPEGTENVAQCPRCHKPTALYMHKGKCLNCGQQIF